MTDGNAQRLEEQFYQSKAAPAAEEAQEETKAETLSQTDKNSPPYILLSRKSSAVLTSGCAASPANFSRYVPASFNLR